MKKILLAIGLIISSQALYAQIVNPANITEAEFQPNVIWDIFGWYDPSNSNAHSHGDLNIGGVNEDLYVFTWDNAMGIAGDGGFAVWQMPAGISINAGTASLATTDFKSMFNGDFGYPDHEIRSLEAGILQQGNNTYIALTYYDKNYGSSGTPTGFYLNLYTWNGTALSLTTQYTLNFDADPPEGWIHQDVNNLNKIVITWEREGGVYTKAGEMTTTGLVLGNTARLHGPYLDTYGGTMPDVAMIQKTSGETQLVYVATTSDKTQLLTFQGDFNALYTIPVGTPPTDFNVDLLYAKNATGQFGLPRIDAPDNAQNSNMDGNWSCTAAEHAGNQDFIWAITHSDAGGIIVRPLNDGSLAAGMANITANSGNPDIFNRRPTVAFSNTGHEIFYAWSYRNPSDFFAPQNATYLSVKTTLGLQLINSNFPIGYFQIPQSNINTDFTPSVALSTQNDASPQLFTSFIQWPNPFNYDYYIGLKTVDWNTTTGYKPGNTTGVTKLNDNNKISLSPNPFRNGFQLSLKDADDTPYQFTMTNILGQKVYSVKGKLSEINKSLSSVGEQLSPGNYIITLQEHDAVVFRQKLVKW